MSHIHIPDGVLPWWLWVTGWVATALLLGMASRMATRTGTRRAVPLVGAISALVLVAMSTEIVPIAYHVNLTVIAGALLGPWLGAISAFIVVLVLALVGHGGITVVGLNTLMIATEMALGWALVHGGLRLLGSRRVRPVAAVSTIATLAITTTMLVGIVALAGSSATARHTGALDVETLEFRNPFSGDLINVGLLGGDDHGHDDEHEADAGHDDEHAAEAGHDDEDAADTDHDDEHGEGSALSVSRFAAVVYTLGPIGWILEALVTAGVLGYVVRVRPSLMLRSVNAPPSASARVGDEHGGR
ncbi:MAG: ABC-type Co2+ transport system permease component-like protein [Actinobacteria bacterium 66_15]|nr:MAG: ABC-type Co2+ transport system permease component-like protein [Actinobacteria bacterium 66_15]